MNLLMKGAALAPPFSCTTKYSSDVYSPRPPDIRVRLLPTKPPVHFTTEQPGRDIIFSMIQTALENQLDPYRYLTWLLQTACGLDMADPAVIQKLLPWQAPDICKAK